ncbi:MAG: hypothetical protein IIC13_09785 [SAR324 cluster bacterium]|nr:hypothetical protein [SAR324 cluster bacterium]
MTAWFILKVVHIFAGVFWLGAGTVMMFFIAPAVKASGPAGGQVMGALINTYKLPAWISHAAWTTTVAGLVLFWRSSGGFAREYFSSPNGIYLTVGAIAGICAFIGAVFVQLPRSKKIAGMAAAAAGNPTPEQAAALQDQQKKFTIGGYFVIVFFAITLLGMLLSHRI